MQLIQIDRICEKCRKVEYRPAGILLASYPPQYLHECSKCGDPQTFKETYPPITYAYEATLMQIAQWISPDEQVCNLGRHSWSVPRLLELARNLPVMDVPLDHLCVYCKYEELTLRQMVMHIKAVNDADLSFPIILDEDGELMDGRHRLMKAMLEERKTIKVVRFEENPYPCSVKD